MSKFGKRIQRIRIEKGKTLEDIHKDTGIAKSTLSRYENDNSNPRASLLIELAKYFDVSIDYLLGLSDDKNPSWRNEEEENEYKEIIRQVKEKGYTSKELKTIIELYPQLKQIIKTVENN